MTLPLVRILFAVAGLYDFVIGLAFLLNGAEIFDAAGVPHPNHWAYIQFGSLLLMVFGVMFLMVAYDPIAHRNLMPFGMLLKISYTGLVGYYWLTTGCHMLFKPFAVIDAVMLILFVMAYLTRFERREAFERDQRMINWYFGWSMVLTAFATGAGLGFFFHRDDFLGGYAAFRRRIVRLGHIALAALGMINVLFGLTPMSAESSWRTDIASLGFMIGGASMPAVCFLSAWKPAFRHLFFIPVTALIIAVIQTLRIGP